jgi:hypothetical protein
LIATAEATEKLDSFAIGDDDEEEDLIDVDDTKPARPGQPFGRWGE